MDPLKILVEGTEEKKIYDLGYQAGKSANYVIKDWRKRFEVRFQVVYGNGERKRELRRPVKDVEEFIESLIVKND